jgi:hypothetical protein
LYASNSYQINAKQQIEFLDFYAFILGMLAGFSFLSRISKYLLEKFDICNVSMETYQELEEEHDRKEQKLEKLGEMSEVEKNISNSKPNLEKNIELNTKNKDPSLFSANSEQPLTEKKL